MPMNDSKRVKSILEEIDGFIPQQNKHAIIEARATNVIAAAANLLALIRESFDDEEAEKLTRRLFNSIKNEDPKKFKNAIRQLKEGTE